MPEKDRLTHNTREGRILSLLRRTKASEGLFHHRLPTSTSNTRNGCHPYSTKDFYEHQYIVVHNGVITNDLDLAREQWARGIRYVSKQGDGLFNDSEALAHDIARVIDSGGKALKARGSVAFVAIQRTKDGENKALFFARNNGNPLNIKATANSLTLSSEGEGIPIEPHQLYRFDYKTQELTSRKLEIPEYSYASLYGHSYNYLGPGSDYRDYENEYTDDDGIEDWEFESPTDAQGYRILAKFLLEPGWTKQELEAMGMQPSINIQDTALVESMAEVFRDDSGYDPITAYEMAKAKRDLLIRREADLTHLMNDGTYSDAQLQEWALVSDVLFLMEEVVELLENEVKVELTKM